MANLSETVFLQVTGIGTTPESAAANFTKAIQTAISENNSLLTREYISPPNMSPILPIFNLDGSFGGYQRHANVAYVKIEGDPEEGWDYTSKN